MIGFLLTLPYTIFVSPPLFLLKLFYWAIRLIFFSPFNRVFTLIALPARTLLSGTGRAIAFAIQIGGGYRDIYIFLSTAALFGLLAGCILFGTSFFALKALKLRSTPQDAVEESQRHASKKIGNGGRTAVSYRREREERRKLEETRNEDALLMSWEGRNKEVERQYEGLVTAGAGGGREGVMRQTIVEEDDSD